MKLHKKINNNRGLKVTPEMYRQARGNKVNVIVKMDPYEFIKVTTRKDGVPSLQNLKTQCKNLEDYNRWADEGETIIMPMLWIDEKDQIVGHEGRHRAASLICAGINELPVGIRLYPSEQHQEKYGYFEAVYQVKYEDLPDYIYGQFGNGVIRKEDMQLMIDGWENIRSS